MREAKLLRARPGLLIESIELSPPGRIALPGLGDGVVLRSTLTRIAPGRRTIGCLIWRKGRAGRRTTPSNSTRRIRRHRSRAGDGSCAGGPVIPHCACSAGCGQCEPTRSPWACGCRQKWRCGLPPWRRTPRVSAVPSAFPNCRSMSCRAGRIYVLALKRKWSCLTPPVYRFRKPID